MELTVVPKDLGYLQVNSPVSLECEVPFFFGHKAKECRENDGGLMRLSVHSRFPKPDVGYENLFFPILIYTSNNLVFNSLRHVFETTVSGDWPVGT